MTTEAVRKKNRERYKVFTTKIAKTHKKLEVWLPNDKNKLFCDNAKSHKLTKANYVISLLDGSKDGLFHGNMKVPLPYNELQAKYDTLRFTHDQLIESVSAKEVQVVFDITHGNAELRETINRLNKANDALRGDNKIHLQTIHGLTAEIDSIKASNARGIASDKPRV